MYSLKLIYINKLLLLNLIKQVIESKKSKILILIYEFDLIQKNLFKCCIQI